MLDLDFVRQQFPAFNQPSLKGSAFFENAGGSYMCSDVIKELNSYYLKTKVQPYHPYPQAQLAGQKMDSAYSSLASWLNVTAQEIYFGPSTSQNTYVLANAMLGWLSAGDEIIVTNQDHEANSGVWRNLAKQGINIIEWQVDNSSGTLDITNLEKLFTSKTKLLVFPHCSNILGEINPVAKICTLAKQNNVRTVVDGVSFAGHGLADIDNLGVDIYLFSLYKVFGPHQGVMVIRQTMDNVLANQGHYFNAALREKRFSPAGPDHAQIAASNGLSAYFSRIYQHHFADDIATDQPSRAQRVRTLLLNTEQALMEPLLNYFNNHSKIRVIGPTQAKNRAPTISIIVTGHSCMTLAQKLGERGVMCGAGHFYSVRLLEAMNIDIVDGVLRFSFVHYTSHADIEKLITTLDALIA